MLINICDIYGNLYELYSGIIYITSGKKYGNIAAYIPGTPNNGLYVIWYGELTPENIEKSIIAKGWRLEDCL